MYPTLDSLPEYFCAGAIDKDRLAAAGGNVR
jgi:hypothetical protein